jgi:hypothetical protein
MTDEQLIEQLRNINKNYELPKGVQLDIRKAADRIEELQRENARLRDPHNDMWAR